MTDDAPAQRARTFIPPAWWLSRASQLVRTRQSSAPGAISQVELAARLRARYDVEYRRDQIARMLDGVHASIEMLEQVSEVLGIPSPIYAARDEDEAARMRQQRAITLQLEAARAGHSTSTRVRQAEAALDAEMASMENDVRIKQARRGGQGPVVDPKGEEANQRGSRSRGGVGKGRRSPPS